MAIQVALLKPLVDAILGLVRAGRGVRLQKSAKKAVEEAIRELLLVNPDENAVETKLAIAKAAGLISNDVLLAEDWLRMVRVAKRKAASKAKPAKKTAKRRHTKSSRKK
jgi:hypothetical protein